MGHTIILRLVSIAAPLALAACSGSRPQPQAPPADTAPSASQHVPTGQLPDLDMSAVLAHTKVLSSDEFEGRAPGSKGEEQTVGYLVDQFKKAGLKPGNTDGTYVQKVPLVGITAAPAPLLFKKGGEQQTLVFKDDFVAWTKHVADSASIADAEMVFVGYGVVAPEFNWDDYKGLDVTGKTIVMLVNDPPVADSANPSELDPKVFGGSAMTYFGRWTYKYEMAAKKGAAAAFIVHEEGPAGYPFSVLQNSNVGEKFDLITPGKNMARASIEGWIPVDQVRRLLRMAGQDFDALKRTAATRDFTPVPLGVTASMTLHNKLRTIQSQNVLAKIEGSDPKLKDEFVVYTAHWDHFGKTADGVYHGAQDNALGSGALIEMGRAFTRLPMPPRRSVLFLAVTAEEQGLLGSEYYSVRPIHPLAKTVAAINMDSWNVSGRTRDLTLVGYGASDLDDYARDAAAEQGRVVHGDADPGDGSYYRSDHFNFARQGVPALDPDGGVDFIGKPKDYGPQVRREWTEQRYHKPADVVTPAWDLSGTSEDLKVYFAVGYRVAQAYAMPQWKAGNEFKAKRDEALRK